MSVRNGGKIYENSEVFRMSNDLENTKVVRCKDGTTKRIEKEQLQINNFFEEHVEVKEK